MLCNLYGHYIAKDNMGILNPIQKNLFIVASDIIIFYFSIAKIISGLSQKCI